MTKKYVADNIEVTTLDNFPVTPSALPDDDYEIANKKYVDDNVGVTDHGALIGLSDDDHTQYHNDTRGDVRYYQKTEFIDTSAGGTDAGKPIKLDADGNIDSTMINDADISHLNITNIGTNTHAQIDSHIADTTTNPHSVDKSDVGLGNVDNTSDATKNSATATLTNKTLTTPKIGTSLNDTNGNEVIETPATASAVNHVEVKNSATGDPVEINAKGDDTNIHLEVNAKGNALTKLKVLRQDNTSDSYDGNSVILTGYGYILGDDSVEITETINFGITFSTAPIVLSDLLGLSATTPTSISSFTGSFPGDTVHASQIGGITTSAFNIYIRRVSGTYSSSFNWGYSWIAIGQLN